ncbi:MAG: hypothetical protein KAS32_01195 [Candidatus Peribacteraceae bacterium]|nr:hypothetical protein [Candidatus Peribacteraceae bacterium]
MTREVELFDWGMGVNKTVDGEVVSYGFADNADPNLFQPDPGASTKEQRQIYKKCLKTWNTALGKDSWENYDLGKETTVEENNTLSTLNVNDPKIIALDFISVIKGTTKARLISFENGSEYWFPRSRSIVNEADDILLTEEWLLKDKSDIEIYIRRE